MTPRERAAKLIGLCAPGPRKGLLDEIATEIEAAVSETQANCVNTHASAERLIAWLKDRKRKPGIIAFTEGPERQVGYAVEAAMEETELKAKASYEHEMHLSRRIVDGVKEVNDHILDVAEEARAEAFEEAAKIADTVAAACSTDIKALAELIAEYIRARAKDSKA